MVSIPIWLATGFLGVSLGFAVKHTTLFFKYTDVLDLMIAAAHLTAAIMLLVALTA